RSGLLIFDAKGGLVGTVTIPVKLYRGLSVACIRTCSIYHCFQARPLDSSEGRKCECLGEFLHTRRRWLAGPCRVLEGTHIKIARYRAALGGREPKRSRRYHSRQGQEEN